MKYTYIYNTSDKYTSINIYKHKYIDDFIHNWPMMGINALRSHRGTKENSQSVYPAPGTQQNTIGCTEFLRITGRCPEMSAGCLGGARTKESY